MDAKRRTSTPNSDSSDSGDETASIHQVASTSTLDTILHLNGEPTINGVEASALANSMVLNGSLSSAEQVDFCVSYFLLRLLLNHQR